MPEAVMLAGDKKAAKRIKNQNKAFLMFRNEPLFIPVVRSLLETREITRIVIVGPVERLKQSLDTYIPRRKRDKEIVVADQGTNILENAKIGFLSTVRSINDDKTRPAVADSVFDSLVGSELAEHSVLYLSCDIPLATSSEIAQFVSTSDMETYDYSIGLTTDTVLEYYAPTDDTPGISMEYYHLNDCRCRHNNLHYGKPLKVIRMRYVERMYELRYQTRLVNVLKAIPPILSTGIDFFSILRLFLNLQRARKLSKRNDTSAYETVRSKNRLDLTLHYSLKRSRACSL